MWEINFKIIDMKEDNAKRYKSLFLTYFDGVYDIEPTPNTSNTYAMGVCKLEYVDTKNGLNKEPFKLEIHNNLGNCELCWKKSDRKIIEDIRYGTRFIDWFDKMEREYDSTMFRGNKSIHDLIKMSKEPTTGFLNFDESEDDGCICSF